MLMTNTPTNDIVQLPPEIQTLENRTDWLNAVSLSALAITLIAGGLLLYFNNLLNNEKNLFILNEAKKLEDTRKDVADDKLATANANARAQESVAKQKELESRNLTLAIELEKLKSSLKDREIPNDKYVELVDKLSNFKGSKIWIHQHTENPESQALAERLMALFNSAQWVTYWTITPPTHLFRGLLVQANDDSLRDKAQLLSDIFNSYKLQSSFNIINPNNQKQQLVLFIGSK